jgi:hypothetical protein
MDLDYRAVWFVSNATTATSLTLPGELLQPNTPYVWWVRVQDGDTTQQNIRDSDHLSFYTGTKGLPNLDNRAVVTLETDSYSGTYMFTWNHSVAPWDIDYLKVTDLDSNEYFLDAMGPNFFMTNRYWEFSTSPFPMTDGDCTFEMADDDGNYINETRNYTYDPVPPLDEASRSPEDNSYFCTKTPTFSWDPVCDPGTCWYALMIRDYNNRIKWWISPRSTDTWVTLPVSLNLPCGSYKWEVHVYDDRDPMNNMWISSQRTFTINPPICECDLNGDGNCDMLDWLLFGVDWGRTDCNEPGVEPCECDINGDGNCDMLDWLEFGVDWGRTDCPVF